MTSHQAPRQDVYSRVTATIIASLEAGVRPWQKPWNAAHAAGHITRPLRANGQPYRGVNVLLLWGEAEAKDYTAPIWMTYKQALTLGAQVRKGEHGSLVVYADKFTKTETDEQGHEAEREIPFMKGYTVFNVEQVDGLPAHFYAKAQAPQPVERIPQAEAFFLCTGATVQHGGNRAFYAPSRDLVQMPPRESFRDHESYVATLAHELTHWTAHCYPFQGMHFHPQPKRGNGGSGGEARQGAICQRLEATSTLPRIFRPWRRLSRFWLGGWRHSRSDACGGGLARAAGYADRRGRALSGRVGLCRPTCGGAPCAKPERRS
jgi:antirestriction protein ArdC